MSYVIDRPIMTFVTDERKRCRDLIAMFDGERDLLLFCIDNAYGVAELDTARQRFEEFKPKPTDDFEDLM